MARSKAHDRGQRVADRGNPVLSHEAVKLLKTQDAGYLRTMAQQTRKMRERLEQEYIIRDGGDDDEEDLDEQPEKARNRHLLFVDSFQEQKQFYTRSFSGSRTAEHDPPDDFSGIERENSQEAEGKSDLGQSQTRHQRKIDGFDGAVMEDSAFVRDRALRKKRRRAQEARTSRLKLLKLREKNLLAAEQELELQRAKMSNSVGGVNKAGVKWKIRQRKK